MTLPHRESCFDAQHCATHTHDDFHTSKRFATAFRHYYRRRERTHFYVWRSDNNREKTVICGMRIDIFVFASVDHGK